MNMKNANVDVAQYISTQLEIPGTKMTHYSNSTSENSRPNFFRSHCIILSRKWKLCCFQFYKAPSMLEEVLVFDSSVYHQFITSLLALVHRMITYPYYNTTDGNLGLLWPNLVWWSALYSGEVAPHKWLIMLESIPVVESNYHYGWAEAALGYTS